MKYECKKCNYLTNDKSNYNRHLNSATHATNIKVKKVQTIKKVNVDIIEKEKAYTCNCGKVFSHLSSCTRHKKTCNGIDIYKQVEVISDELKKVKQELSECKSQIAIPTNTNCHNTYNISVKNYIQQKYPNAPALKTITDYSKLVYKDYKLMDTLVYNYTNKNLHKYLGNFIIGHYKKDNPSEQSMWTSDTSRFTYIVAVLLKNEKSIWSPDYKGTKVNESVITPLLNYVRDCIDKFWNSIEIKKPSIDDIQGIEEQYKYRNNVAKIAESIDNNILCDDILKYITPFFCVDKKDLDIKMIEAVKSEINYFVDTD